MKTVTLCGSMKFEQEMQRMAFVLETKNNMDVLQRVYNIEKKELSEIDKSALAKAHLRKLRFQAQFMSLI